MTPAATLAKMIEELPPAERERIEDYIRLVAEENLRKGPPHKFRFDWAGGFSELKGKYSSVELQKKATEWMSEMPRRH